MRYFFLWTNSPLADEVTTLTEPLLKSWHTKLISTFCKLVLVLKITNIVMNPGVTIYGRKDSDLSSSVIFDSFLEG